MSRLDFFKIKIIIFLFIYSFSFLVQAEIIQFPANFKWGVATSAHQIEGQNINSDHYRWEVSQPARVISQRFVNNPAADEAFKNNSGAFVNQPIPCPIIDIKQGLDPDPLRLHTQLFPLSVDPRIDFNSQSTSPHQSFICEYSGSAIDHWNRIHEDTELLKKLNVQWYRFSIEWAKIEPQKGVYNTEAIQHYIQEIKELQKAGIAPHITLFHFTMPQWLRDEGGWESSQSPYYFKKFTRKIYKELASANLFIPVWYTFNEPMVHIFSGYLAGVLPPGKKDVLKLPILLQNILQAHALSYRELHALAANKKYHQQNIRVGVAHHLRVFEPLENLNMAQQFVANFTTEFIDYVWNWMFIDAIETGVLSLNTHFIKELGIPLPDFMNDVYAVNTTLKGTQDFLGLNYYSRDRVAVALNTTNPISLVVDPEAKSKNNVNDMGWEIYPEGFYKITKALYQRVQKVGKRNLPLIISENGIADRNDVKRIQFIKTHLKYLKKAMDEGVPVDGYCYWSVFDNFEWNSGYYPQFGLYSIDFQNKMNRIARPSASFYSELSKTNQFEY